MGTYVFVHGAWHGGWCWERVGSRLAALGHVVLAPTLTGVGERAHLASREVGVETHVRDVRETLEQGNVQSAVLVGHSYAGMVITAVAHRVPERIARVVYLDAVVPRDGDCLYDRAPERVKKMFEDSAEAEGDGWLIPTSVATAGFLGLESEEDRSFVLPRLTPHPIRTFRESVRLGSSSPVARSYLNCIGNKPFGQPRSSQAEGIDDYHELRTGHDAMVTTPDEVVRVLSGVMA